MAIKRVPDAEAASSGFGWFVGLMGVIAIFVMIGNYQDKPAGSKSAPQQYAKIDKSAAMQIKREKLISNMLDMHIFSKVDMDGIAARVTVGREFHRVDFEMKQTFIGIVYAQKFDGTGIADFVRVLDNMTGKEIGMYSAAQGGLKMY